MATKRTRKSAAGSAPTQASSKRARSRARGHDEKEARRLGYLGAEDGKQVLIALVARHPELVSEVAELVEEVLGSMSFERVADAVLEGIANLEILDMGKRSGRQPFGYVGPGEAAGAMIEEVIEPFVDRIERCAAMGLHEAALEVCRGVLLGLYRAERCDQSEVVAWIPDGLSELTDTPIGALGRSRGRRAGSGRSPVPKDLAQFAEELLPEWTWLHR